MRERARSRRCIAAALPKATTLPGARPSACTPCHTHHAARKHLHNTMPHRRHHARVRPHLRLTRLATVFPLPLALRRAGVLHIARMGMRTAGGPLLAGPNKATLLAMRQLGERRLLTLAASQRQLSSRKMVVVATHPLRPRLRRWWHVGQLCQVAWGVWARGRGDTPRQPLVRQGKATSCGNCPHLAPVTRCSARGQTATIGALLVAWARWEKRGKGPQSARPPDKRARGPLQAGRIPEAAPPLRPSN